MSALTTIQQEAHELRTVIIDAYKKDGTREQREVEAYSIRQGVSGDRLMFYCLKRDDWRSLLVSNIIAARPTGTPFTPRERVEF